MRYTRTQIYLDPEEHRRLVREAADRGVSLTEHLRRIIAQRSGESAITYETDAWDGLVGIADSGSKDTVATMDIEIADALAEAHERATKPPRRRRVKKP